MEDKKLVVIGDVSIEWSTEDGEIHHWSGSPKTPHEERTCVECGVKVDGGFIDYPAPTV